jgi:hypothetical protein
VQRESRGGGEGLEEVLGHVRVERRRAQRQHLGAEVDLVHRERPT